MDAKHSVYKVWIRTLCKSYNTLDYLNDLYRLISLNLRQWRSASQQKMPNAQSANGTTESHTSAELIKCPHNAILEVFPKVLITRRGKVNTIKTKECKCRPFKLRVVKNGRTNATAEWPSPLLIDRSFISMRDCEKAPKQQARGKMSDQTNLVWGYRSRHSRIKTVIRWRKQKASVSTKSLVPTRTVSIPGDGHLGHTIIGWCCCTNELAAYTPADVLPGERLNPRWSIHPLETYNGRIKIYTGVIQTW